MVARSEVMSGLLYGVRSGDWFTAGLGAVLVLALAWHYWQPGAGERLLVKRGGNVFLETSLARDRDVTVNGPLGVTRIEVRNHRARVISDPGPRQLCVREGWISRSGQAAICLPNQVSVEVVGKAGGYDSLSY